ncbi:hypothetical protein PS1_000703 [Malus domestica]
MAMQKQVDKMQLRKDYRNLWHTDWMGTVTADCPYISRRDLDPTPTPVIVTPSAATTIASRSNFKAPVAPPQPPPSAATSRVRYRECLKNHAANSGGHVFDGCGEFMLGGDEDTPGSLKCAACKCHRNFHRKEIDGEHVSNN